MSQPLASESGGVPSEPRSRLERLSRIDHGGGPGVARGQLNFNANGVAMTINGRLARSYRKLFGNDTLRGVPSRPEFVFDATNLQSGDL